MNSIRASLLLICAIIGLLTGCDKEEDLKRDCVDDDFFSEYSSRNFEMGFSTWAYAPSIAAVDQISLPVSHSCSCKD